ncbi:MAG: ABC transporter permease subunit [Gluconacetobacter diazotrophicus]|nr:ABC transporter permease subunit [Gluconacetobacter diazotrophicus]
MRRRGGGGFWLLAAGTALLLVCVSAPFAVVVAGSVLNTSFLGLSTEQWAGETGTSVFSLHWFGYVWGLYHEALAFSLRLAVLSTLACLLLGVPGACGLALGRFPGRAWLEVLVNLPLALPGIAMSIALIQAYAAVRGSWWLIFGGHLLYTLPFMVRIVAGALRSFDLAALDLCARGLGAGFGQRFAWIFLPNLRRAMVSGCLMVFAVSWGEFNVSYLLNTPLHQTFPAALYATYTSNSFQVAGAATTIFLGGIVPALLAIQVLGGEARSQTVGAG